LLLACSSDATSSSQPAATPDASTDDIIGGVDASGASLDAIGALVVVADDGTITPFCTGTLVAPTIVLSAKHCVIDGGSHVSFVVGVDARAPRARYVSTGVVVAPLDRGGYAKLGQDVALFSLAEPVAGITPLRYASTHLPASSIGTKLTAVGYGVRDQQKSAGLRKAGTLTLQAVSGQPLHAFFPTVDDLRAKLLASDGEEWINRNRDRIQSFYDHTLLAESEVFLGLGKDDAQPCSGDSGGPLLARVNGENIVVGVVSASFKTPAYACSVLGEFYASFGPDVQTLLTTTIGDAKGAFDIGSALAPAAPPADEAKSCADLGAKGVCEGDVAVRCVPTSEGPEKITKTDCALIGAKCGIGPSLGAECLDPTDRL
jgi:secreted trypsin-like serine protease